jgi:hypothetical protein
MNGVAQDLRYAARQPRRHPGFRGPGPAGAGVDPRPALRPE